MFWELSKRLPDNCIISADSGSTASWFARDLKMRKGMKASLSGNLATMCPGVPYAIAAKFAFPERMAIALVGDGAMQMLGITDVITISKYWKRWSSPKLMILVLNNSDLNMVSWEQRIMIGDAKFEPSQDVPYFPYAQYAESLGLMGIRVDKPEDIPAALDRAMAADRPVIFEAVTDPSVPPLPPHIELKQMKDFMSALMKGDSNALDMVKQSWKDILSEYFPAEKK